MKRGEMAACVALLGAGVLMIALTYESIFWSAGAVGLLGLSFVLYRTKQAERSTG